jgi:hypothetical protein
MRKYWAVLLAALGFVPLACAGPPPDASSLVSSWATAANAHDLTEAESLFSPDAVIDDGSGASGTDRVHNWNAMVVDRFQIRVERVTPISSTHASALVAISSIEASRPMPARSYHLDVESDRGKIRSFSWRQPDLADWTTTFTTPVSPVPAVNTTNHPEVMSPLIGASVVAVLALAVLVVVAGMPLRKHRPEPSGELLQGLRQFSAARNARGSGET